MNLKTFTAPTMPAALALVKQSLGPAAVILHTRTYKRGGFLGFRARTVVEITAADKAVVAAARRKDKPRFAAPPGLGADGGWYNESAAPPNAGDLIRRTYAAAYAELSSQAVAVPAPAPVLAPSAPGATPVITPVVAQQEQLTQEMREMRRMVATVLRRQREQVPGTKTAGDIPPQLFDHYLTLLKQEVTEELAEDILQRVKTALTPAQLTDRQLVQHAVHQAVAQLIPVDDAAGTWASPASADRRPRTLALIGPTGVGKTTTIAKLAANFKLKQKKNVGLITLDTYRIAAVDQLRTYAQIIGLPLHVVANPDEMAQVRRRCAGCDVVLIDTAGRSQRDDPRLEQLATMLRAADPHEVHLVLSSTCTQAVLLDIIERFSKIRTDRIIFTKLDEAVTLGVLLNVARKVNKRLSFVTTGQEVPHHIEPGRPDRLAALVLGEGV